MTEEQKPGATKNDREAGHGSFFEELRRREVLKTAGIYAGGAWLLTEILLAVLDRSPFPESVRALAGCIIVSVFIAGFPVALILAWFFDLSRRGIRRDSSVARGRLGPGIAALALVILGTGALMWQVNPCGLGRILGVAVLPCSYYGAPGHEYQGPGIASELNYRLSHLPQLRVPAWPSVSALAGRIVDPGELSETLHVDRLVECGMRRSEARLSINLQLYDPGADRNLWADEYEGQASDELLLIAEAFRDLIGVDGLNVSARAGGRIENVNAPPTASAEAWKLFQKARLAEDEGRYEDALAIYRETAGLDPGFARAHAGLARLHWMAASQGGLSDADRRARLKAAWIHGQRALTEAPHLAEALAIRRVLMTADMDPGPEAEISFPATDQATLHEQVIDFRPSYAQEYYWWSQWLDSEARAGDASDALEKARRLDPAGKVTFR